MAIREPDIWDILYMDSKILISRPCDCMYHTCRPPDDACSRKVTMTMGSLIVWIYYEAIKRFLTEKENESLCIQKFCSKSEITPLANLERPTHRDGMTALYHLETEFEREYYVDHYLLHLVVQSVQALSKLQEISRDSECVAETTDYKEMPIPDVPCVPQNIERNMFVHPTEDLDLPAPSFVCFVRLQPKSTGKVVHRSCETEVDDTQIGSTRTQEESNKTLQERDLVHSCPREAWSFKERLNDEKHLGDNEEFVKKNNDSKEIASEERPGVGSLSYDSEKFLERKYDSDLSKHTSVERPGDGNLSDDNEEFVERSYNSGLSKHSCEQRPGDGNLSDDNKEFVERSCNSGLSKHSSEERPGDANGQEDETLAGVYSPKKIIALLQRKGYTTEERQDIFAPYTYQSHFRYIFCMGPDLDRFFPDSASAKESTDLRVKKKNSKKARKTDVNIKRQVIDDRWIRFEGEPQIKIQQSLKKRRGVVFGTASRQGYKGFEDIPDGKRLESSGMTIAHETNKRPLGNLFSFPFNLFSLFPKLSMSPGSPKLTLKLFVLVSLFCCSQATGNCHEFRKWDVDVELFFRGNSNIWGSQYYCNNSAKISQGSEKRERSANISSTAQSVEKLNASFAKRIAALLINDFDAENLTDDVDCWILPRPELDFQQMYNKPEENGNSDYLYIIASLCTILPMVFKAFALTNKLGDDNTCRCDVKITVLVGTLFSLVFIWCLIPTKSVESKESTACEKDDYHGVTECRGSIIKGLLIMITVVVILVSLLLVGILMHWYCVRERTVTVCHKNRVDQKTLLVSLLEVGKGDYGKGQLETDSLECLGTDETALRDQHSGDFVSLKTKPQDITIDDIENLRSDQQRQQLIDEVYSSKCNKNENIEDDFPLTVAENEVEIHQCCQRKRFTLSQTEEILFDYMSEDLIQEEVEEALEKNYDIDSDPFDFTETQYIGGAQNVENELVSDEKTQKIDIPEENTTSQDRGASYFGDQPIDCNEEVPHIQQKPDCNTVKKENKPSSEVKQREIPKTSRINQEGEILEIEDSENGVGAYSSEVQKCFQKPKDISEGETLVIAEIDHNKNNQDPVSVILPDVTKAFGASRPLEDIPTLISRKGSKLSYKKKQTIRMKVVPTFRNNSKTQNSFRSFQNLKYKVEGENTGKRKIDCTLTEQELDIFLLRRLTWLPLDQLPAPTLDHSVVGFVQEFEPLMVIIDLIASGTPPSPHVSMRYELLRFCTLRSYPKENKPYLIKLAEAGFYYASDGDGVVCYCCGVRRYNWTAEDNPRKIHERVNPNCKFLKKNEEVNVPVAYFGPFSESLVSIIGIAEPEERPEVNEDVNSDWAPERIRSPAPRPQNSQMEARTNSLGINTSIPKHTQYATKTSREVSFSGWPDTASHSPQELAEAGFFYAGFGDCVRCFFCGIGLRHWTKDDNPWIEHARWARNCVFVKQKKGEEFVNLVQLAVQYSQNNEEQTSESATGNQTPSEIERLLLSDAAQSVLEMGYQPSIIKKAIEQILRQNSNAKLTAANLMEKVLDIEEAEKEATPVAAAPAATASEKALEGAQPTGKSTKENKDKEKQTDTKKETDKKKEKDHNRGKEAAMLEAKMKANETKQQDPKVIKEENEQLKEQTLCKVCLDNTVCIVFLPCGHLVTCADCAPAMRKCPICRALVKGTVRTYMS